MSHTRKSLKQHNNDTRTYRIFSLLLVTAACCLVLSGCNESNRTPDNVRTPTDMRKAELQAKLDRRFEQPNVHYELGHLYQDDRLWAKAQYHYSVALTFDPAHRPAQAAMVKVLQESGDAAKSRLSADIYMDQVSGSASESAKLAMAFQKEGLDEYTLAAYKQALRLAPTSASINRQIGYYYLGKNNTELAKEYLTRSFQLDPNQPDVAGELGRMGVEVQIPRTRSTDANKVDRVIEEDSMK